jgi:hypothetical protein
MSKLKINFYFETRSEEGKEGKNVRFFNEQTKNTKGKEEEKLVLYNDKK